MRPAVIQFSEHVMQFSDNPGGVASRPIETLATGALEEFRLAMKHVFRDHAQGRFPGHGGEQFVTFAATA